MYIGRAFFKRFTDRISLVRKFISDVPILIFCIGYLVGDVVAIHYEANTWYFWLWIALFAGAIFVILAKDRKIAGVLFLVFGAILALLVNLRWLHAESLSRSFFTSEYSADEQLTVKGYISAEPRIKHEEVIYEYSVTEILSSDKPFMVEHPFKLLIKSQRYPVWAVGQICTADLKIVEPKSYPDFDYKKYLRNRGIYYIGQSRSGLFCEDSAVARKGWVVKNTLYDLKLDIVGRLQRNMPEPHVSLLIGILMGEDRLFDEQFMSDLRVTGTTHIIAASGYNVTVLLAAVNLLLLRILPFKARVFVSILIVWGFILFSGGAPSLVRAGIMSTTMLIALLFGRRSVVHLILPLSCTLFAIFEPRIIYNLSFQLSIAATAGLIYLLPLFESLLQWIGLGDKLIGKAISNLLLPTLACTIMTLPITAYYFGEVSLLGIISNLLILPVVEGTLSLGVVSTILIYLIEELSQLPLLAVQYQMQYFISVVEWLGRWELGVIEMHGFKLVHGLLFLLSITLFVLIGYPLDGDSNSYYTKRVGLPKE